MVMNYSFDPLFDEGNIPVNQKSQRAISQFHMGEDFREFILLSLNDLAISISTLSYVK